MNEPRTLDTLGLVETRTIAQGVGITDRMLKTAGVDLIRAATICSGRYMIQVAGPKADVQEALDAAAAFQPAPLDMQILSWVSRQVIRALKHPAKVLPGSALGLVESRRAISGIAGADAAVKKAGVTLARLAVANGINGKSYLVVTGNVAAVSEAVQAACDRIGAMVLDHLVLPNPDPATLQALCPGAAGTG